MARHDAFRAAVESEDHDAMRACLSDDVTFHSPALFEPVAGIDDVAVYLRAVSAVFEDFVYTGAFRGDDDREVLEFRTRVGDRQVQGIDLLTFDDDGQVTDLTVMLRPLRGLEATIAAMGRQLAAAAEG
jgi:hypothetical protein